MGMGLLFDATRCIGCGACSSACKEQNKLPGPVEEVLTAYTWTTLQTREGLNMRRMCMHCEVPTCASVCPVAALVKTPEGPVVYDGQRCMGCRYCMMACPFEVPKYQWDRPVPVIGKCVLCASRIKEGKPTACAEACPAEATIFGKREDLVWEARTRLRQKPGAYVDHIYGLGEAGGTSVLMIANAPFDSSASRPTCRRNPRPCAPGRCCPTSPTLLRSGASCSMGCTGSPPAGRPSPTPKRRIPIRRTGHE